MLACTLMSIADAYVTGWVELGKCDNEELSGPINAEARKCLATKRQKFKGTSIFSNFSQGLFTSQALRIVSGQLDAQCIQRGRHASNELANLCELTEHILPSSPPRIFSSGAMRRPFLLFTDGAWVASRATAGLVLHDPDRDEVIVREIEVPQELVALWLQGV